MISTPQVKRYPAIFDFVTQRLEYLTFNEGVGGSNPPGVTTLPNGVTTSKNSIGPRRAWRHTVIVVLGVSVNLCLDGRVV